MTKPADTDYPVHELIRDRYSPRAFGDRAVTEAELRSLLEAARWAPSCFNEQPWSFLVATREDEETHRKMLECLVEGNRVWADRAPVLLLAVAKGTFSRNGKPNRHAWHDVGLAVAQLTLQATALGLRVHQMAGILPDRAREIWSIPEGYDPVTAIAIGAPGDPTTLPENLREMELAPRTRRPQGEFVFSGRWGEPLA